MDSPKERIAAAADQSAAAVRPAEHRESENLVTEMKMTSSKSTNSHHFHCTISNSHSRRSNHQQHTHFKLQNPVQNPNLDQNFIKSPTRIPAFKHTNTQNPDHQTSIITSRADESSFSGKTATTPHAQDFKLPPLSNF